MPFTIRLENRLLQVYWTGILTNVDLQEIYGELPRQTAELGYAPDVVHNFDEVTDIQFVFHDLVSHSRKRVWSQLPNPVRSAAVGSTPLTFGFGRMFQSLNANPQIEMEVFGSKAEALTWLAEPRGP